MTPYFADDTVTLYGGDALDVLASLPDGSVDSVVTDPPYGLAFMGKAWDTLTPSQFQAWSEKWSAECLRVLKPGGHLLAFGGTRTYHRLACAVEDAGFEIRDSITWLYGSGFPKSLDVGKAIDKAAGAEREAVGDSPYATRGGFSSGMHSRAGQAQMGYRPKGDDYPGALGRGSLTAPATEAAQRWQGWGTALKPASEPIVVARKPLTGTVAANVLAYGTGALNIDATRVAHASEADKAKHAGMVDRLREQGGSLGNSWKNSSDLSGANPVSDAGRWPANVVLTHAPGCDGSCVAGCPVAELDQQSGTLTSGKPSGLRGANSKASVSYADIAAGSELTGYGDSGGASRFFPTFRYQAKAPASQRPKLADGTAHPTVKPLDLMRWLVRLVTPPDGTVLDPFAGSGTTLEAATLEGFRCVGIERDPQYLQLCQQRLSKHTQPDLFAS